MEKDNKYDSYTKDELIDELETLKKKKYGLVWDKKNSQEMLDAFVNWENVPENFVPKQFPVLKEIKNKEIKTDEGRPANLLIEGDNYHSLAVLNFTHQNKIDVIYIDPPYNTGNEDFIYNDKFIDKEDPYRHSKWLSFMDKRLRLSYHLLKNTGVIFVSIDDNEFAQLKLLCDEIFGEEKLLGIFTWVRKKKGSNLSKEFRKITEYVIAYKGGDKQISLFGQAAYAEKQVPLLNRPNNISELSFPPNKILVGSGVKDGLLKRGRFGDGELVVELLNDIKISEGVIVSPFRIKGRFRWSQSTTNEELKNGSIFTVSSTFRINVARYNQADKVKSPSSLLTTDDGIGTNEDATEELRNLFPDLEKLPFDYPKPTSLIKYLVASVTKENKQAIILDYMAGSGTTGHAVLQLNKEDEGERQFILCTNNDNNICTDVCYPRIGKAIEGYKNSKGEKVSGLGGNLKYFKTDFVGSDTNDKNKRDLVKQSTEMICIKEDIFDLIIDEGFDFKIYQKGKKFLGVVFDISALDAFKTAAERHNGDFSVYCFSYNETTPEKEFKNLKNEYTFKPIPAIILKVYSEIFKK